MTINIRDYRHSDCVLIADLYRISVHSIDEGIYSKAEQEAWAPSSPDYVFWEQRLSKKLPFVACIHEEIVGFIELESDGHIDCLYTHPAFQGRGVANKLYEYLLDQAEAQSIERLYVEASKVALPFFLKRGFYQLKTNHIQRNGMILVNYSMECWL